MSYGISLTIDKTYFDRCTVTQLYLFSLYDLVYILSDVGLPESNRSIISFNFHSQLYANGGIFVYSKEDPTEEQLGRYGSGLRYHWPLNVTLQETNLL